MKEKCFKTHLFFKMKKLVEAVSAHSAPELGKQVCRIPYINNIPWSLLNSIPLRPRTVFLQGIHCPTEAFLSDKVAAKLKRSSGHVEKLDGVLSGVLPNISQLDIFQEVSHVQEGVFLLWCLLFIV